MVHFVGDAGPAIAFSFIFVKLQIRRCHMTTVGLESRRNFLLLSTAIGTGVVLGESAGLEAAAIYDAKQEKAEKGAGEKEGEVTAAEDLMREHGVLRRAWIAALA
jgi:hypothetical protein